ncbi:MAG: hypothetical protein J7L88_04020, partial [Thermoplasmata archaeon]|nr:hypothetical protein [Thermoplasmata archaeon]
MRRILLATVLASLVLTLLLPQIEWGEGRRADKEDSFGYFWVDSKPPAPTVEYNWLDVKSSGTKLTFTSAGNPATISLPFSVPFYGRSYNKLYVSSYGFISFQAFSSYYGGVRIPSSYAPNAVIAVYSCSDSSYYGTNSGTYYTVSTSNGAKYVAIEWVTNYDQNYEVIIYEGGLIKMQYRDVDASYSWYSNGNRAYVGIEDHSGTVGTVYCANSGNIQNKLAIIFTKFKSYVNYFEITNGDGNTGKMLFAKYRTYHMVLEVKDDGGWEDISEVFVQFGNFTGAPVIVYDGANGTISINDPRGYMSLVEDECIVRSLGQYIARLTIAFQISFTFPQNGYINITVDIKPITALPVSRYYLDMAYVISRVVVSGVPSFKGSVQGKLESGDFVKGGELVNLTGLSLYYNMTVYSPPNEVFSVYLEDNRGRRWWDNSSSGRRVNIVTRAPEEDMIWNLHFGVEGIPEISLIMAPIEVSFKVDNSPPPPPFNVKVHDDYFNSTRTEYDDDREIFITWEEEEEDGSGISHYVIIIKHRLGVLTITVSDPETKRYRLEDAPLGRLQVGVGAVDKVGNVGEVTYTNFTVDLSEVEFKLIQPEESLWVTTKSPQVVVEISDPDTKVDGPSVEYSISTDGGRTWSSWKAAGAYERKETLQVQVTPTLREGKRNLIRFRARDVAGNPPTISPSYNVWVDSEGPTFFDFYPGEEWLGETTVTVKIKVSDGPGSGVNESTVMYRYSRMGPDHYTSWTPLPGVMDSYGVFHAQVTISLSRTGQNLIQFCAKDLVGHESYTPEYVIHVDNPPEVSILSPANGESFLDNQTVMLKCSVADRDGNNDTLSITWSVDGGVVGEGENAEVGPLSPGIHTIQVTVKDSFYTVKERVRIRVEAAPPTDPYQRDTDGDGIPDGYEIEWGLDPEVPDSDKDKDGDGYTNLREYLAGTDPTKSSSRPGAGLVNTSPSIALIALLVVVGVGLALLNFFLKRKWNEKLLTMQSAVPGVGGIEPSLGGVESSQELPAPVQTSAPLPPAQDQEGFPLPEEAAEVVEEGKPPAAPQPASTYEQEEPSPYQYPSAPPIQEGVESQEGQVYPSSETAPVQGGEPQEGVVGEGEARKAEEGEEESIPIPPPPPPP